MARPPLVLGTWGKITRAHRSTGWVAFARFRDYDGVTRQVERRGSTGAAAERELLAALRDRARLPSEDLTPETRLSKVLDDWIAGLDRRELSEGTKTIYKRQAKHIRRGIGSLQLREVTVPAVDRFLLALAESSGPESSRLSRVVLSGVCAFAVRKGAMDSNPVRDAETIARRKPEVLTLDVEAAVIARAQLAAWDAGRDKRGRPRVTDLAEPVEMILATGMRTGELFALRSQDVELDREDPRVSVTGTAVHRDGGLIRQEHPKNDESNRLLVLPPSVVPMLRRRLASGSPWVFASSSGTMRSPNNFRTQWRKWREAHGYADWVVPKTFRKALATFVANELGIEAASDQLGHAKGSRVTKRHYVALTHLAPDIRETIELLMSPALTQRESRETSVERGRAE